MERNLSSAAGGDGGTRMAGNRTKSDSVASSPSAAVNFIPINAAEACDDNLCFNGGFCDPLSLKCRCRGHFIGKFSRQIRACIFVLSGRTADLFFKKIIGANHLFDKFFAGIFLVRCCASFLVNSEHAVLNSPRYVFQITQISTIWAGNLSASESFLVKLEHAILSKFTWLTRFSRAFHSGKVLRKFSRQIGSCNHKFTYLLEKKSREFHR